MWTTCLGSSRDDGRLSCRGLAGSTIAVTLAVIPATSTASTSLTVALGSPAAGQWTPVGLVNGAPTPAAAPVQARLGGPRVGVVRVNAAVTRRIHLAAAKLEVLEFRSNHTAHQPVIEALRLRLIRRPGRDGNTLSFPGPRRPPPAVATGRRSIMGGRR